MEILTPTKKRSFAQHSDIDFSPIRKRVKQQQEIYLELQLEQLEKQELVNLLVNLCKEQPGLEQSVSKFIPKPTIKSAKALLNSVVKKLNDAIPYSKLGNYLLIGHDRSDYAYHRIKPQRDQFASILYYYLDLFTLPNNFLPEHEYSVESMDFLNFCTTMVNKLPVWDNRERNLEFKIPLYEKLSHHWRIAINETAKKIETGNILFIKGKIFGVSIVGGWVHNLSIHCQETEGYFGFKEALSDLKEKFGWIIGLDGL